MAMFANRRSYDTTLTPQRETDFQKWRLGLPANLQGTEDYDLRGAWLANASEAANGHLPDTWKKPNHMTFSTESLYSTPQAPGGNWAGSDNHWVFWASPENLRQHTASQLDAYFRAVEPDSALVLPIDYRLPRRK